MFFLVLAVLVIGTAAATVWLVLARAPREKDPDSTFWYAFAGLCVLVPMILIPALTNNLSSVALFVWPPPPPWGRIDCYATAKHFWWLPGSEASSMPHWLPPPCSIRP